MTLSKRAAARRLEPESGEGAIAAGLVAVIRRLAVVPTLAETMAIVTEAVRSLLKADGATFVLKDGALCHYAEEDAVGPLWKGRRFPVEACISGWCMSHDQALSIPDIYLDERIPMDAYRPTFVRSLAFAPVRRTEPFAAIGAYWSHVRHTSQDELDLLQTLADASGLAISVAQLAPVAEARLAAEAAEARYRAVFDQAAVGVARVSPEGRFLEVNDRFCEITGYTAAEMLERGFPEITHPEDLTADLDLAAAMLSGATRTYRMEKRYIRKSGTPVWVNLTVSLVRDGAGAPDYFIAVAEDISQRKAAERAQRTRAAEFHALAENIPSLCWMAYADGRIYWYNQRWYHYTGWAPGSLERWSSIHEPEVYGEVMERWGVSLATGAPFEMTFPLRRHDGKYRPFLTRIVPIRDAEGRITRWFGSNTDVADQQQHEERLKLLINELNHRVKNTLATVQSIAAQTLRGTSDPQDAFVRLESRLLGLSAAHNILTERNWEGATLAEVVERTLSPFAVDCVERLRCAGPEIWLPPQPAVALSLAIHELATNAVKYGAWSGHAGRIEVDWALDGRELLIRWRETGGPPVTTPTRRGFGSRLIERSLPRELGAPAVLSFEPAGLICEIRVALPAG